MLLLEKQPKTDELWEKTGKIAFI